MNIWRSLLVNQFRARIAGRALRRWTLLCVASLLLCLGVTGASLAQETGQASKWREMQIGPKPDWSWLQRLRIVTEADFPPFNYYDDEGQLAGFNVDLARAICRELGIPCDITTVEWSAIVPTLKNGEADAAFASIAITEKALNDLDFTNRYYTTPARFVGKTGDEIAEISSAALKGKKIAVVKGTSHEAFLRQFFPGAKIMPFEKVADAREALKKGDADLIFGDGISLMFWVQGTDSARCCEFKGGAYTEPRYFGDGVGIAMKRGNTRLKEVLDYALAKVRASGRYEELMFRYFPLPLY